MRDWSHRLSPGDRSNNIGVPYIVLNVAEANSLRRDAMVQLNPINVCNFPKYFMRVGIGIMLGKSESESTHSLQHAIIPMVSEQHAFAMKQRPACKPVHRRLNTLSLKPSQLLYNTIVVSG
jgi:hypothetical protein